MQVIDPDNMISFWVRKLSDQAKIKGWFDAGEIVDVCGNPLTWEDCRDGAGDLCVDEDAYDEIKTRLGR